MKSPLVIAHRGASFYAPENTMSAVNLAWQQNTDALEIDVHITKNKEIVVIHDADTSRTTGFHKIIRKENYTSIRQLDAGSWKDKQYKKEYIPLLKEVLETIKPGKKVFIEIKGGEKCLEPIKQIIGELKLTPEQITIMDFNFNVIQKAQTVFPHYEIIWLYEFIPPLTAVNSGEILSRIISQARLARLDGINIEMNPFVNKDLIKYIHDLGMKFYTWTINDIETAKQLKEAGIDGITTDRPDLIKKSL